MVVLAVVAFSAVPIAATLALFRPRPGETAALHEIFTELLGQPYGVAPISRHGE
jgi:hypothetical protein